MNNEDLFPSYMDHFEMRDWSPEQLHVLLIKFTRPLITRIEQLEVARVQAQPQPAQPAEKDHAMKEKYILSQHDHEIDRFNTPDEALDRLAAIEPFKTVSECQYTGYKIEPVSKFERRQARQDQHQVDLDKQITQLLRLNLPPAPPGYRALTRGDLAAMPTEHLTQMIDELEQAQTNDPCEVMRIIGTYRED